MDGKEKSCFAFYCLVFKHGNDETTILSMTLVKHFNNPVFSLVRHVLASYGVNSPAFLRLSDLSIHVNFWKKIIFLIIPTAHLRSVEPVANVMNL